MKVRWTGERRALTNPQVDVAAGDVVDVADGAAASLIEQGLAEPVGKPKKEID